MPVTADRCKETSTTTGTGDFTLAGPSAGFASFLLSIGVGPSFYYCIAAQTPGEWEVGIGHLSASTTLVRDSVIASSNSGSLVNFSAGTTDVFATWPSSELIGILNHERGGLEADVSAYAGLVKISGGATSQAVAGTDYIANAAPPSFHHYTGTFDSVLPTGNAIGASNMTNFTFAANYVYYVPFFIPRNCSDVRDIQIRVVTGVALTGVRCAIYPVGSDGLPAATLVENSETGELDTSTSSTNPIYTPPSALTLVQGAMYFAAFVSNGAPSIRGNSGGGPNNIPLGIASGSSNHFSLHRSSFTYGVLPSTPTAPTQELNSVCPAMMLRFTS